MIAYRDRAFCGDADQCGNRETCLRWLSPDEKAKATHWWGGDDFPVAFVSFKSTCSYFKEEE